MTIKITIFLQFQAQNLCILLKVLYPPVRLVHAVPTHTKSSKSVQYLLR